MKPNKPKPDKPDPASAINPRMLTIPMVAKYISATNWFVEVRIRDKQIPARMQGKSWVVDLHDINAWIDEQNKLGKLNKLLGHFPRIMTDAEAQQFFAGVQRDEDGNFTSEPDAE